LLRGAGGLTAWLAPPQAWAWRPWRADAVRQTDWVGCVLPHAAAWYRRQRVPADFVGHPLASAPPLPPGRPEVVALLPGSRPGTAARLLPLMLEAAARLRREVPSLEVVWGRSPGLAPDLPDGWPAWARVADGARAALRQAGSAWVGAGTATLDAVLAGRPCVVVARLDPAAEWLAKRLVRVPAVGLPNLVLGRRAFPECVLQDCTPAAIAAAALGLLHAPETWAPSVEAVRARLRRSDWGGEVATHLLRLLARRAPPMLRASPASPAAGARERGGSDV
ncbi:MAG: hypothetical protein KC613_15470, partial [Myxococcales bacterium]|nr:hypothetical protein [Myxococcales bacterium]